MTERKMREILAKALGRAGITITSGDEGDLVIMALKKGVQPRQVSVNELAKHIMDICREQK